MSPTRSPKRATRRQPVARNTDIVIQGARMHNLKNITVAIPRNKLVVVTGVSGSGKSSLTMDTLFAEGQRRYAESLSSYARQFLMRMDKPDVDFIRGICPAIAIEQKVSTRSPRSTVGSMTELQDYLRLLFARIGRTYSPVSGKEVKKDDVSDVVDFIRTLPVGTRVHLIIPFSTVSDRDVSAELQLLMQKGFSRLYVPAGTRDGTRLFRMEAILDDPALLSEIADTKADRYILIDRLVAKVFEEDDLHRIADSVQTAYYEGEGACELELLRPEAKRPEYQTFNNRFEADGMTFEIPTPHFFSANNPFGACPVCEGFGQILGISEDLVIPDKRLSVYEDAVVCWKGEKMKQWKQDFIRKEGKNGFPVHQPVGELTAAQYMVLQKWIDAFFKMVDENLYKIQYRVMQARYRGRTRCPNCRGTRLRPDALYVQINGKDIAALSAMPVEALSHWFSSIRLTAHESAIARRIITEITQRLKTLLDVGLNYLTLDRPGNSLSGGESQRIQLTKFLASNLTDSLYILDEPSIGLHPRDTSRLIRVLKELRDLDNTVVVVEHDEMMMQEADHIIDMGPLAAHLGGSIVAAGTVSEILEVPASLTGQYLSGSKEVAVPPALRAAASQNKKQRSIILKGCRQHNLKDIDVTFPLHKLCVVTGVSGSGKTTLVRQTLYPALQQHFGNHNFTPGIHQELAGDINDLSAVEMVSQNPIGKSSRSNPVTYVKAYDEIRNLFAGQKLARIRGFQPRHFSFNVAGGRCETCKGEGTVVVEMQFLADIHLVCEQCKGKRFQEEVLDVTYHGKNIYDVLALSVDEAIEFFKEVPNLVHKLQPLSDVGLGYIKLGQSSNTLSGGESQRVKLASFLGRGNTAEKILFIFDEPTTGLHFHDINKLLASFFALLAQGHSIIVIEHNTDVIRNADWIIDIGPEGGSGGGNLLYSGPLKGLKNVPESYTAQYI